MNRKIVITSCITCPHKDHKGAFGSVSYVPVCRLLRITLPHTTQYNPHLNKTSARINDGIYENCPLDKD